MTALPDQAAVLLAFAAGAAAAAGAAGVAPGRDRLRSRLGAGARALVSRSSWLSRAGRAAPTGLSARIVAAGRPAGLGPRELMAMKLAAAGAGAAIGLLLAASAPGRLGLPLAAGAPVAGFLTPDAWLGRKAAERAREIRSELAYLLDLLAVAVESGASLARALGTVGERARGPLAAEWNAVGREVAAGVPVSQALGRMSARVQLSEIRTLVAALERGRHHGTPLGETLRAQARDARISRGRRAREEAARAGPKMQLAVSLLLVPSVLLLVAAALAAALLESSEGLVVP